MLESVNTLMDGLFGPVAAFSCSLVTLATLLTLAGLFTIRLLLFGWDVIESALDLLRRNVHGLNGDGVFRIGLGSALVGSIDVSR